MSTSDYFFSQEGALKCEIEASSSKDRIEVVIPNLKLISFANEQMHWAVKRKKVLDQQWLITSFVRPHISNLRFPLKITLIRISPKKFDSDNLQMAFKYIKDKIAHLFFPKTKLGMADDKDCFVWQYQQIQGETKEHKVIIVLEEI